jgi:L-2-hydroxyglutarate oxidase
MTSRHLPVAVIGGGIVGLATAAALAERGRNRVVVLEAEPEIATHQTGHNSGVLHSGLYYRPGSLKAETCRTGLAMMYRFCEEEGIPVRRTGKLVLATTDNELGALEELARRGAANGVRLRRVGPAEVREIEPHASALAGLHVPETGVVDFRRVARAMGRRLEGLGGEIRTGHRVIAIERRAGDLAIETTAGAVHARGLVNCAGLQADRVARMAGLEPGVRIVPFRGEYYTLRSERNYLVRGLIYPVPDPALPFLGVHLTRGIDGVVEAGPNAVLALKREGYRWRDCSARDILDWVVFPGFWRLVVRHWKTGWDEVARSVSSRRFARSLQRLVPAIAELDLAPGGAGVRAQAVAPNGELLSDFLVLGREREVHVLNTPSPAATASLAIGSHIERLFKRALAE